MKEISDAPRCPAVAGAVKANVTREVGVGVGGLTDSPWPDELAVDVVVTELVVEDAEAEPECVADVEPPPHAASARTVASADMIARVIGG
jgi:hypothetical protein